MTIFRNWVFESEKVSFTSRCRKAAFEIQNKSRIIDWNFQISCKKFDIESQLSNEIMSHFSSWFEILKSFATNKIAFSVKKKWRFLPKKSRQFRPKKSRFLKVLDHFLKSSYNFLTDNLKEILVKDLTIITAGFWRGSYSLAPNFIIPRVESWIDAWLWPFLQQREIFFQNTPQFGFLLGLPQKKSKKRI